jgi:hypothetical protein
MIVFTSVCSNYIPKAQVLAESLKRHNPDVTFIIGLTERSAPAVATECPGCDGVILSSDMGIESFDAFIFKHSIVEASTAVKGHIFLELLRRYPHEQEFVYLDPDIQVFGPLDELKDALSCHDIVMTPHLCEPEDELFAIMDNEICALKHGVFNLGFLAIRRTEESQRFIQWWSDRLLEFCYADIPGGLFTDQRWMDLAPCFFDVHVFRHAGYNVAPWNLSKRKVVFGPDGQPMVNGLPLRFFHFSGFDSGANELMVLKYCPDRKDAVYKLRADYIRLQEEAGQAVVGKMPWSYEHRSYYRFTPEVQQRYPNPFDASAKNSFCAHVSTLNKEVLQPAQLAHNSIRQLWKYTKEDYSTGGMRLVTHKVIRKLLRQLGK